MTRAWNGGRPPAAVLCRAALQGNVARVPGRNRTNGRMMRGCGTPGSAAALLLLLLGERNLLSGVVAQELHQRPADSVGAGSASSRRNRAGQERTPEIREDSPAKPSSWLRRAGVNSILRVLRGKRLQLTRSPVAVVVSVVK